VEGTPNIRVYIGEGGNVVLQGEKTLFLNFGNKARAESFLSKRIAQGMPGVEIKSFEVQSSFLEKLRSTAIPESFAKQFPNKPIIVDITKAPDQFGLRLEQILELNKKIIQGTGRK
jgi:filamentous hemagglutinin